MRPRVGIIDSGVGESLFSYVSASRRFSELPGDDPAQADGIGHGDRLARLILQQCPEAQLLVAQVFMRTTARPFHALSMRWIG